MEGYKEVETRFIVITSARHDRVKESRRERGGESEIEETREAPLLYSVPSFSLPPLPLSSLTYHPMSAGIVDT